MNVSTENFTSTEVNSTYSITNEELMIIVMGLKTVFLGCNLLFGVPTHSYVLWLIAQGRRIPSEILNVNLTVCEIIYSLSFFIYLSHMFQSLELQLLHRIIQGICITVRPLFQSLICVERYLAVVHPVTFLKFKPLRYRVICCSVVWIITLGSCLAAMTIQILSNMKTYTLFYSLQFLIFFSIQLFCLVAVLRALKQSGPGQRRRERREENHMKRRAFHLILITTVTLVVMFIPFVITGFLTVLQQQEQNGFLLVWSLGICCFILAGFVQPVLYLHRAGKLFFLCSLIKGMF